MAKSQLKASHRRGGVGVKHGVKRGVKTPTVTAKGKK